MKWNSVKQSVFAIVSLWRLRSCGLSTTKQSMKRRGNCWRPFWSPGLWSVEWVDSTAWICRQDNTPPIWQLKYLSVLSASFIGLHRDLCKCWLLSRLCKSFKICSAASIESQKLQGKPSCSWEQCLWILSLCFATNGFLDFYKQLRLMACTGVWKCSWQCKLLQIRLWRDIHSNASPVHGLRDPWKSRQMDTFLVSIVCRNPPRRAEKHRLAFSMQMQA